MTSISSLNSLSAKTGIGGLVSGMDIDELVQNLTTTSRERILKQQQSVQKLEWKQTSYRSVTTALKEFQSKYLDVLSSTNFRSTSFFNTIKATSSSSAISVESTAAASAGNIIINEITQLATNQTIKSTAAASKPLVGKLDSDVEGIMTSNDIDILVGNIHNKSLSINLDGKVKTLTFDDTFVADLYNHATPPTTEGLQNAFQKAIDRAFGTYKKVGSEIENSFIEVNINQDQLTFSAPGSQVTIYSVGGDEVTLGFLGLTHGQSNKIISNESLQNLSLATPLDNEESYTFTINSVEFEFNNTDTLSTVMSRINSSNAGVTISYSSISDTFSMVANNSGAGENIVINDTKGNFMEALGLLGVNAEVNYGVNALLKVNGQEINRSSNNINIDGVKIELLEKTSEPINVTMKDDATLLLEPFKKFVEDYNSMINLVNSLIKEKVYSDYQPLSDEQKEEMSETQIKNWEEKAKSGLLRGDTILKGIALKMQSTMYSTAINGGISLHNLGITSAGYLENGKLQIDESKLKEALKTKGNEIRELFTSEKGLGNSLNDIIVGAIKTSGVQGKRGTLVEMAGVVSTSSDTENNITEKIQKTNKVISALQTRLSSEESRLWNRFTAMETALQQLNSQSSIISQFSTSGS